MPKKCSDFDSLAKNRLETESDYQGQFKVYCARIVLGLKKLAANVALSSSFRVLGRRENVLYAHTFEWQQQML